MKHDCSQCKESHRNTIDQLVGAYWTCDITHAAYSDIATEERVCDFFEIGELPNVYIGFNSVSRYSITNQAKRYINEKILQLDDKVFYL
jgi:hypothetical protein